MPLFHPSSPKLSPQQSAWATTVTLKTWLEQLTTFANTYPTPSEIYLFLDDQKYLFLAKTYVEAQQTARANAASLPPLNESYAMLQPLQQDIHTSEKALLQQLSLRHRITGALFTKNPLAQIGSTLFREVATTVQEHPILSEQLPLNPDHIPFFQTLSGACLLLLETSFYCYYHLPYYWFFNTLKSAVCFGQLATLFSNAEQSLNALLWIQTTMPAVDFLCAFSLVWSESDSSQALITWGLFYFVMQKTQALLNHTMTRYLPNAPLSLKAPLQQFMTLAMYWWMYPTYASLLNTYVFAPLQPPPTKKQWFENTALCEENPAECRARALTFFGLPETATPKEIHERRRTLILQVGCTNCPPSEYNMRDINAASAMLQNKKI